MSGRSYVSLDYQKRTYGLEEFQRAAELRPLEWIRLFRNRPSTLPGLSPPYLILHTDRLRQHRAFVGASN